MSAPAEPVPSAAALFRGVHLRWFDDPAQARPTLAEVAARPPRAIALSLAPHWLSTEPRTRLGLQPLDGPGHIVLAWQSDDQELYMVVIAGATPAVVGECCDLIQATFCVFFSGQEELACLAEFGVFPQRLATIVAALVLLAQGNAHSKDVKDPQQAGAQILGSDYCRGLQGLLQRARQAEPPPWDKHTAVSQQIEACALLLPLAQVLVAQIRQAGMVRAYELENRVLPAVVAMQEKGIMVDVGRFEQTAAQWQKDALAVQDAGQKARLAKLISTYRYWARDFTDVDGRMRYCLQPLATDSGRFACSTPNLQQVPSEHTAPGLRRCFIAPPGHQLIVADYAQIELRVAAHVAGCDKMRQVFVDNRDPHRATAATLTGKAEDDVTGHERKLAKAINFGFLFGMGAPRFQEYAAKSYGLNLDLPQAQAAREAFFATFPGIAAWHRKTAALGRQAAQHDISVVTLLGRRKRFAAGAFSFSAGLNIPVQGSAAEGFKSAMVELHRDLPPLGACGVLCVHDEYLAQAPSEHAQTVCEVVQSRMQSAMQRLITTVPIRVEAAVVATWGDKD